jgi:glutathione S-transferase
MITLYVKSPCQYSARAIAALDIYNVPFIEKNIADPKVEEELLEIGGKHKVPFLVDGDIQLYESDNIVAYIEREYANKLSSDIEEGSDADTREI